MALTDFSVQNMKMEFYLFYLISGSTSKNDGCFY